MLLLLSLLFARRARLPEYVLDFGLVILGTVCTRAVRATNRDWLPASFSLDRASLRALNQRGFHVELPSVVQLPGAPEREAVEFLVVFDPRGANLDQGKVEKVVTINVILQLVAYLS